MLRKMPKLKSNYSTSVRLKRRDNGAKLKSEVEKLLITLVTRRKIFLVAPRVIDKEYGCKIDSHNTGFRGKFNGLATNTHLPTNSFSLRICPR